MKKRIHMRIFFPVMILLVLFPILSWLLFSRISDWYVRSMVSKEIRQMMGYISQEYKVIYQQDQGKIVDKKEERQKSKQFLALVKDMMKQQDMEARLLVLNSKKALIYPGKEFANNSRTEIYEACRLLLENNDIAPGTIFPAQIGEQTYMFYLFEVEADNNIRAKYFIGYAPVPETDLLISYTGKLMFVITLCLLIVAAIPIWLTAKSIAAPLKALCHQANRIGNRDYEPIAEQYSVAEAEELKKAFNYMAVHLKDAEAQNTRFFQNVSHDLRTPLVSISGYAQGIQCGVIKDYEKAAGIILSESLRLTELVESILMISSLDRHEFILRPSEICLNTLLDEQAQAWQGIDQTKKLILYPGEQEHMIETDASLLIRILQNILSNCFRFAKTQVELWLETEKGQVIICIGDDGEGIPEKELKYIFERFYKGESGNYGIGLSIVKSGTEYLGGQVTVKNREEPLHGALYQVSLPIYRRY